MKKLIFGLLALTFLFVSCSNSAGGSGGGNNATTGETQTTQPQTGGESSGGQTNPENQTGGTEPTITKFTINFQTEHGILSNKFKNGITIEENASLTTEQLPTLSADGYAFGGWYDGETLVVANTYKVTKSVTLTAKWTVTTVSYTISYESGHGTIPTAISLPKNTVLTEIYAPTLTEEGYRFDGWYDGETLVVLGSYTVTKTVTLIAKWTRITENSDNFIWIMTKKYNDTYSYEYNVLWIKDKNNYETKETRKSTITLYSYNLFADNYSYSDDYYANGNFYFASAQYKPKNSVGTWTTIQKIQGKKTYNVYATEKGSYDLGDFGMYNYHSTRADYNCYYHVDDNYKELAWYVTDGNVCAEKWYYIYNYELYNGLELKNRVSSDNGISYSDTYELIEISDDKMTFRNIQKLKENDIMSETVWTCEYTKFFYGFDSGEKYMSYHLSNEDFSSSGEN